MPTRAQAALNAPEPRRDRAMKLGKNTGMMLLAVWLILFGVLTAPFLKFDFAWRGDLLAILAIAAGVFLLLDK
jgi:hypothetical protein